MSDKIDPIVVHGQGRSGTTLLVRLLALHPDLAWFNQFNGKWPGHPVLGVVNRVANIRPATNRFRDKPWFPQASEAIGEWDRDFPGFWANSTDWEPEVDPKSVEAFNRRIEATRRWHGKPGFLTKYTGYPRYDFVHAVLPAAQIVHIDRDPRAVVMSMIKQRWGYKQRPEDWAALTPIDRIDLAGNRMLRWNAQMVKYEAGCDYRNYRYEDLVRSFDGTLRGMVSDLGLTWSRAFERRLRDYDVHMRIDDWQSRVTDDERAHLEELLAPVIEARGYAGDH
jgi:hypothetical protein